MIPEYFLAAQNYIKMSVRHAKLYWHVMLVLVVFTLYVETWVSLRRLHHAMAKCIDAQHFLSHS